MTDFRQFLKKSVENVIAHGDTDIFPFPVENIFFHDKKVEVTDILDNLHINFWKSLTAYPIYQERALQVVGYFGYRWGTQIDPIWNAYLLALVLAIADDIESSRIDKEKNIVFSYRYKYDKENKNIFDKDYNWRTFGKKSIEKASEKKYVLKCDISDFYPRIYHHRIENALKKCTKNTEVVTRIKEILSRLSKGASYGLPVGGPASRLLSELLLSRVDKLLILEGLEFCRYADDYLIFANSIEEAYAGLIVLSEKLHENEGLSIQKSKTQIMTVDEFKLASEFSELVGDDSTDSDKEEMNFLKLRLFYDPYSPSASEDYEELRSELNKFDIIGMLGKEISKSRINQALTRRLINAVKYLSLKSQQSAILSIIESLDVLYPVFPSVMILLRSVIETLDQPVREGVFSAIRNLIHNDSYITKVTVNMAFAIRILAHDKSDEADLILGKVSKEVTNAVIKRDIILAMAQRDADYWVSDRLKYYGSMMAWEKRSLLMASFILGDEGDHWRKKIKQELAPYDQALLSWFGRRVEDGAGWGALL